MSGWSRGRATTALALALGLGACALAAVAVATAIGLAGHPLRQLAALPAAECRSATAEIANLDDGFPLTAIALDATAIADLLAWIRDADRSGPRNDVELATAALLAHITLTTRNGHEIQLTCSRTRTAVPYVDGCRIGSEPRLIALLTAAIQRSRHAHGE